MDFLKKKAVFEQKGKKMTTYESQIRLVFKLTHSREPQMSSKIK